MISMICGTPGSGKSTAASYCTKKALKGKPVHLCGAPICPAVDAVFTNFPFPGAYRLNFDDIGKVDFRDCLIVIDEAMLYMDSRDFKNFAQHLKEAFAEHRKVNCHYLIISQAYDDVDKKVRNLTVNLFHCVKLPFFDLFKLTYIEPFFDIRMDNVVTGYEWGRTQIIWGKPIFKLFNSYGLVKEKTLPPPKLEFWNLSDAPKDP